MNVNHVILDTYNKRKTNLNVYLYLKKEIKIMLTTV